MSAPSIEAPLASEADSLHLDVVPSSRMPRAYRLTALRHSSAPPKGEELEAAILDVLLAAAHADGVMCGREKRTVRRIMLRLTGGYDLPPEIEQRIESFDPAEFDRREAAELLLEVSPAERRHVIELVREVCDANNAFDI